MTCVFALALSFKSLFPQHVYGQSAFVIMTVKFIWTEIYKVFNTKSSMFIAVRVIRKSALDVTLRTSRHGWTFGTLRSDQTEGKRGYVVCAGQKLCFRQQLHCLLADVQSRCRSEIVLHCAVLLQSKLICKRDNTIRLRAQPTRFVLKD